MQPFPNSILSQKTMYNLLVARTRNHFFLISSELFRQHRVNKILISAEKNYLQSKNMIILMMKFSLYVSTL